MIPYVVWSGDIFVRLPLARSCCCVQVRRLSSPPRVVSLICWKPARPTSNDARILWWTKPTACWTWGSSPRSGRLSSKFEWVHWLCCLRYVASIGLRYWCFVCHRSYPHKSFMSKTDRLTRLLFSIGRVATFTQKKRVMVRCFAFRCYVWRRTLKIVGWFWLHVRWGITLKLITQIIAANGNPRERDTLRERERERESEKSWECDRLLIDIQGGYKPHWRMSVNWR